MLLLLFLYQNQSVMKNPSYTFKATDKKPKFKINLENIIMQLLLIASILLIGYLVLLICLAIGK